MIALLLFSLTVLQAKAGSDVEDTPDRQHRVLNGDFAPVPLPPSLVYIEISGGRRAAGTFAVVGGTQVIITAADVLHRIGHWIEPEEIKILLGTNNIVTRAPEAQQIHAKAYGVYFSSVVRFDFRGIALIIPNRNIVITTTVQPANLLRGAADPNWKCSVFGWGKTSILGENNNRVARSTVMNVVNNEQCNSPLFDQATMLCAKNVQVNAIPFEGDEGGPLICSPQNVVTGELTVGVFTWKTIPGQRTAAFSSIPLLMPWIERQLRLMGQYPLEKKFLLEPLG